MGSEFETSERFKCTDKVGSGWRCKVNFYRARFTNPNACETPEELFKCGPGDYGNW